MVINSEKILPSLQSLLCTPFIRYGEIKINLVFLIAVIWTGRTISIILKHIQDYYRFRHLLDLLPETEDQRLYEIYSKTYVRGQLSKVKIIVHNSVKSPAIIGFLKPVIILPNMYFNDDELLGVFIHENTHFQFGHCLIICITELIRACFWWNPFFKELKLPT